MFHPPEPPGWDKRPGWGAVKKTRKRPDLAFVPSLNCITRSSWEVHLISKNRVSCLCASTPQPHSSVTSLVRGQDS